VKPHNKLTQTDQWFKVRAPRAGPGKRSVVRRLTDQVKAVLPQNTLAACIVLGGAAAAPWVHAALYPSQPAAAADLLCISESGVSCFNPQTMELEWRALRGNYTYEPVISGSAVLAGSSTGLHVRHAGDGSPHWRWNSGRETASPAVGSGIVYAVGHGGRVAAMTLAEGRVRWARRLDGHLFTPAVLGGQVVTARRGGVLAGLSAASGRSLWRYTLENELVGRPVTWADRIIVTSYDGSVLSLSPSGEVMWRKQDPAPSFPPSAGENLLVFGGMDGKLRARDPKTGDLLWQAQLSGQLSIPPRLQGDRIAVATPDGELVILNVDDGEVQGRTTLPGTPLGGPLPLASGEWRIFFRDAGEISWLDAAIE